MTAALLLLCFVALTPIPAAGEWPQIRHDARHSGAVEDGTPVTPGAHPIDGGVASPVVPFRDGVLVLGDDGAVRHYAASTMARRWTVEHEAPITATPVVANGTAFVVAGRRPVTADATGALLALDGDGSVLWQLDGGGPIPSAPAVRDGRLYAGIGATVVAVDPRNGVSRWSSRTDAVTGGATAATDGVYAVAVSPAAARRAVLNGTPAAADGSLYALTRRGERRWRIAITPSGRPAVDRDHVYVGTVTGEVVALERDTGRPAWRHDVGAVPAAPAVADGTAFVGTAEGRLVALEATNGSVRWSVTLPGAVHAPAIASGTVHVATRSGHLAALDRSDGDRRWNASLGGEVPAPPTVIADTVHVAADDTIYAFEADGDGPARPLRNDTAASAEVDRGASGGNGSGGTAPATSTAGDGLGPEGPLDGETRIGPDTENGSATQNGSAMGVADNATPATLGDDGATSEGRDAPTEDGRDRYGDLSIVVPFLVAVVVVGAILVGARFR